MKDNSKVPILPWQYFGPEVRCGTLVWTPSFAPLNQQVFGAACKALL